MTMTEYVNQKRIENAQFLLVTTDLAVSVVGQRCGIQDDNYFTKIFKKYTGKTPREYRTDGRRFVGTEKFPQAQEYPLQNI